MAIKPHCVVCGFDSEASGSVEFADYDPGWSQPLGPGGSPIVGWSNELGITASPGVGLFCDRHLRDARRLKMLTALDALDRMAHGRPRRLRLWP